MTVKSWARWFLRMEHRKTNLVTKEMLATEVALNGVGIFHRRSPLARKPLTKSGALIRVHVNKPSRAHWTRDTKFPLTFRPVRGLIVRDYIAKRWVQRTRDTVSRLSPPIGGRRSIVWFLYTPKFSEVRGLKSLVQAAGRMIG